MTTAEDFEKVVAPEPRAKERQDLVKKYFEPIKANDTRGPTTTPLSSSHAMTHSPEVRDDE